MIRADEGVEAALYQVGLLRIVQQIMLEVTSGAGEDRTQRHHACAGPTDPCFRGLTAEFLPELPLSLLPTGLKMRLNSLREIILEQAWEAG